MAQLPVSPSANAKYADRTMWKAPNGIELSVDVLAHLGASYPTRLGGFATAAR